MIPTRRTWWLAALGIPIAALGALVGIPGLSWVYNGVLALAVYLSWRMGPDGQGISVVRKFDPVLSVRTENRIELTIMNQSPVALKGIWRDEPPPAFGRSGNEFPLQLGPEREARVEYHVRPPERGSDYFRGSLIRCECPWGLAYREIKMPNEQVVRVYPNVLALRQFDLLNQKGHLRDPGLRISRIRGLGTEFESLRDYAQGDDYRKIDWKASARRAKLVVRQYEQERNQQVILCVDIGRHMLAEVDGVRKLDHVLDSVLMLAHAAHRAGDCVGLLVYGDEVKRYIPPRKGHGQVGIVIDALHDLVAEPIESDPLRAFAYLSSRTSRRSLLVHFTECTDGDRARALVQAFGPMARKHLALLARVSDPLVGAMLAAPVTDRPGVYRHAAAILATDERNEAKSLIDSAGIHQLEAEPQDLAGALVRFYFMVKERALL